MSAVAAPREMKRDLTVHNHRAEVDAGSAYCLAFFHRWPCSTCREPSPTRVNMRRIIGLTAALLFAGWELHAADPSYEQRFSELLAKGTRGFVSDTNLVDPNCTGPVFGPNPLPFSKFSVGELRGIKLGMTMSQVVAAWVS